MLVQVRDWITVRPLLPIVTVEGKIVWLKRCQMRRLRDTTAHKMITQYRVIPVSSIWP